MEVRPKIEQTEIDEIIQRFSEANKQAKEVFLKLTKSGFRVNDSINALFGLFSIFLKDDESNKKEFYKLLEIFTSNDSSPDEKDDAEMVMRDLIAKNSMPEDNNSVRVTFA